MKLSIVTIAFAALALVACSSTTESAPAADPTSAPEPEPEPTPTPSPNPTPTPDAGTNNPPPPPPAPGKKSGTGTYESNIGDFTIAIADVMVVYKAPKASGAGFKSELEIEYRETVGICADRAAGVKRAGYKNIEVGIETFATTLQGATITPGTYKFGKSTEVDGYIERRVHDAMCASTGKPELPKESFSSPATMAVNEIVITTLTPTHVTGSYELRAADGKYVKGTFDADICAASSGTPQCLP